jgi:hypothetical protein
MFEIFSTVLMGGIVGYSYLKKTGISNDADKIQRIAKNCGLIITEKNGEKSETKTIHLYRRSNQKWGTEYVYRIPLGLSFDDFKKKLPQLQDGMNNNKLAFSLTLNDLKAIFKSGDPVKEFKERIKPKNSQKEVELSYDGMLHIRVYQEPLTKELHYDESILTKCKGWEVPIGESRDEFITHCFDIIAHLLVAGLTRYGKTVFLKNVITTLTSNKPDDVKFTLIDLKGGLAFSRFKHLKQVNVVATDLDTTLESLQSIHEDMIRKMVEYESKGYEDISESKEKQRHFIIIDEAGQMAPNREFNSEIKKKKNECDFLVSEIARIGAGIGYRLIYCTQYPTNETINSQVRQMCDGRLCFRVKNEVASRVVLDQEGADKLPLGLRGRAIYQTDRNIIVQTPLIKNSFIEDRIKPHIVFKPRREKSEPRERTERGTNLIITETS